MIFIKLRKFISVPSSLRVFILNVCYTFSNVSPSSKYGQVGFFPLELVDVMNYISWFSNVEPALHTWYKFHLITVYNSFYTLLDLICWCFVKDFCVHVHEIYWSIVFFSYHIVVWFHIRVMLSSQNEWGNSLCASILVLEARNLSSWCPQGCSFWRLRGRISSMPLLELLVVCWRPLAFLGL